MRAFGELLGRRLEGAWGGYVCVCVSVRAMGMAGMGGYFGGRGVCWGAKAIVEREFKRRN